MDPASEVRKLRAVLWIAIFAMVACTALIVTAVRHSTGTTEMRTLQIAKPAMPCVIDQMSVKSY